MPAFSVAVTVTVYTARMHSPSSLRMVVLGSGSSGNAIAVTDGRTTVLVDCGFSAREASKRLSSVGLLPASVDAILVTHEHGDHVRGIDVFSRRHAPSCEILATRGTIAAGALPHRSRAISAGASQLVGTMTVTAFATSHDAAEPVGYRIDCDAGSIGIATDTGVLTPEAADALRGCDVIGLECNHDERMLKTGPYPAYLKRRILSYRGHLSNDAAADALESLAHARLRHVFALHRSRTNNTKELAGAGLQSRLRSLGLEVPVTVASQIACCDSDPPQQSLFG